MKIIFLLLIVLTAITSCHTGKSSSNSMETTDAAFQKIADEYLKGYFKWRPLSAVTLGLHEGYDGKTTAYNKKSLESELIRLKHFDVLLDSIDKTKLSDTVRADYRILQMAIKNEIFSFEDLHIYTHNPMTYAQAIDINTYLKRNFSPLEERVIYIISSENAIPSVIHAAKDNLEDSLPRPYIETAIEITNGNIDFMKGDLIKALSELRNDSLMKSFKSANENAIKAYADYLNWLKKEKLPMANNSYAIGKENFKKMLLYNEGIMLAPEKILEMGLNELKKEQDEFNSSAKIINSNKKPTEVFDDIQKEHPSADSLMSEANKTMESIRQFVVEHKICSLPSEVRVQIKETPQYQRATSTASMDVAGPFEKKATESYYYINPIDSSWNAKQKEDWLRQFDYYTTDNVTIHEVYPGHYTQFLHLNASPVSNLRKIFGSYAFIEGWAHYCERMMIEQGFGNDTNSITSAKHRIAMSGDALLRICRLIASIKIHCQGMSIEDGTKFFMANWYHGKKPSYQEALRGSFDPGYLFYTIGKLEILKLRSDFKQQEGNNFSLLKFHDAMLDNGMPPVILLRELLLKDKEKWNEGL